MVSDGEATTIRDSMNPALSEGLDRIQVGLFRLDEQGCLIQFNSTAARILGVDDETDRDDLSIFRIDRILGSGLGEKFTDILNGSTEFVHKNLRCTNINGRYMELHICCLPVRSEQNGARGVVGILRDANRLPGTEDQSPHPHQELQILAQVAAAHSSTQELSQILKAILTGATASQGLGFNRAFLFLYDEGANQLVGHMAVGPSSAEEAGSIWGNLDTVRTSLAEMLDTHQTQESDKIDSITRLIADAKIDLDTDSLLSDACNSGRWINLETTTELDQITVAFADRLGTRKMAIVPMVSKGRLRGLLAADNKITGRPISDDAVQLLQILGNQAAVAMERARLYDAQRERAEELERINQLLAESQDQIVKFEKMSVIGELTSAIAHELRNPLTIVGGFANLMIKSDISDEQREYLNIISSETRRAESVLHHVLDFSRASKGENTAIDFSGLVERNLKLLLSRLQRTDVQMFLSLAREKIVVHGNNDQLSHAVYQLLKLVGEELIPPGTAEVRTELDGDKAVMLVKICCPDEARDRTAKLLKQVFTQNRASLRLTILVAGETIKYHGGNYGLAFGDDGRPSLFIELPVLEEGDDE